MEGEAGSTPIIGNGFTVIVTPEVLVHPLPSVPVTIYEEVVEGFALTDAPVESSNPAPAGLHV